MPRIAIVGLACSTFLILLSSSAVPQEARAGACICHANDHARGGILTISSWNVCRDTELSTHVGLCDRS